MVAATSQLAGLVRANAVRLPPLTDASFASFFNSLDLGAHKVVLLGDGSHGTSEFYSARAEITKHLIQHHGFTIVAAEADWPDAEAVDRYVRRRPGLQSELSKEDKPFKRFPTWMWRNAEMQNLVHWMRDWNDGVQEPRQRAGFYGLDLYSLDRSLEAVLKYLQGVDPEQAKVAKQRYGCIKPFAEHPERYGLAALKGKFKNCEDEVVKVCRDLLRKRLEYSTWKEDGEEFHSAEQNARLVEDAIEYYKAQYRGGAKSWNLRDQHM
jgi:erythromycin esterase-like protein